MKHLAVVILWALAPLALAEPVAITGVTVVDTAGGPSRAGMTVLFDGERIGALARDGQVDLPQGTQLVDGRGKFLIPGLWDMHVHWNEPRYLALFIANGVTGVRIMWSDARHFGQREQIAAGTLTGPRLALAGNIIDGPKPFWPGSVAAATEADGRAAVRRTHEQGFDYVKVYSLLPREVFFAIADEAKKRRIPFVGHVPDSVRVAEASIAGMKSIEHLTGLLLAVSGEEGELRRELAATPKPPPGIGRRVLETYDARKAASLYATLKANDTWQVPTFTVLHSGAYAQELGRSNDPRMRYMPAWVRTLWASGVARELAPLQVANQRRLFDRRLQLVGEMHRAGVGILAGSDVLNPYCFPGFSLHDELEWLVKAGLHPMAALQAATRNPALFLGREKDLGTIEPGKLADLVLLEADPTLDIRNTRRIAAVVAAGKLHSRAALDQMLAEIEALAAAN
jgi:imidazolonepropionase-like amidohydrolase